MGTQQEVNKKGNKSSIKGLKKDKQRKQWMVETPAKDDDKKIRFLRVARWRRAALG